MLLDDAGFVLDEGARVNVRHVVLGGGSPYTGLAADVRGDTARLDIDTRYLASGSEQRDFNYVVRQRGRKTVATWTPTACSRANRRRYCAAPSISCTAARAPRAPSRRPCFLRARAWTTRPCPRFSAMKTTWRATMAPRSGTFAPSNCSTLRAAAFRGGRRGAVHPCQARGRRALRAGRAHPRLRPSPGRGPHPWLYRDIDAPEEDAA